MEASVTTRRRTLKGMITRVQTTVDKHDIEPLVEDHVQILLQRLDQLSRDGDQLLLEVGESCNDEQYQEQELIFSELDDKINSLRVKLLEIVRNAASDHGRANNVPQVKPSVDVRLPKLELPTFAGSYNDWLSFHDLFVATVHNNRCLSGAQKLQYLKASLRGEAALLLQSVQVTDGNYDDAWDMLIKRYQNKREIINSLLDRMLTQPNLQQESASALRKLIDTSNECLRAMEVLKIETSTWDPILVHIITKKLDPETRRHWELSLSTDEIMTFKDFTEFVDQRARALAAVAVGKANRSQPSAKPNCMSRNQSAIVHHGTANSSSWVCDVCGEHHLTYKCLKLLDATPAERVVLAKKRALCFNCLRGKHNVKTCQSGNCRKCGGKHHTLLHYDDVNSSTSRSREESVEVNTLFSSDKGKQNHVLLATALIMVRDEHGREQVCRALLDSGSQASFVTERCVQRLGLERKRTTVIVSGLGSSGVGTVRGSVQLQVSSLIHPGWSTAVTALILPKVTGTLPHSTCDPTTWTHIEHLKLADPTFAKPAQVDILIGADKYADLLESGRIQGPSGSPTAVETVLGWILSGSITTRSRTSEVSQVTVHHVSCDIDNDNLRDSRKSAIQRFKQVERRLAAYPSRWKTFVENRVAQTQLIIPATQWHHVSGIFNPADCASREVAPSMLGNHSLWWHGPPWLSDDLVPINSGQYTEDDRATEEENRIVTTGHVVVDDTMLNKFSSLLTLKRVRACCRRFITNARLSLQQRQGGFLTCRELDEALQLWIKVIQAYEFQPEIDCINKKKALPSKSRLLCLNPFLDETGVLRVGGRLRKATLTMDQKHPMLLPRKHHLTKMIIQHYHATHLHARPQLLQAALQQRFWIINGRDVIRHQTRKCVICTRYRAQASRQIMGNLPAARISPTRQLSQLLVQHFWRRWNTEYLSQVQQRPKALLRRENLQLGDLVVMKDERLLPLPWQMGRICNLHPGEEQCVRVVTIRTAGGEVKRPILKVCFLPIDTSVGD